MKRAITVLLAVLLVALTLNAVHEVNTNNELLHLQEIKLRNTQAELQKLEEQKSGTDAEVEQLRKREAELEAQLQAKRLIREQEAKVYAERQKVAQTASARVTSVVSGTCADWLVQAGIPNTYAVAELIRKESGCNPAAINRSSGACGIPQALPCSKMGCSLSDPVCQLRWMDNYVKVRYGTWENALAFHLRNNWY